MKKPSVYIETSVVSYLAARPSRDLIVAAHQQITQEWWETRREGYQCYTSELTYVEARKGDPEVARRRLQLLEGMTLLVVDEPVLNFAEQLVSLKVVPENVREDAIHIALSVLNQMNYLVTWNFKHIAKGTTLEMIQRICIQNKYIMPIICSPQSL